LQNFGVCLKKILSMDLEMETAEKEFTYGFEVLDAQDFYEALACVVLEGLESKRLQILPKLRCLQTEQDHIRQIVFEYLCVLPMMKRAPLPLITLGATPSCSLQL
jgi:hypothetical protein